MRAHAVISAQIVVYSNNTYHGIQKATLSASGIKQTDI